MYRRGGNLPPATYRVLSRIINRRSVGRIRCSGGNLPPTGPQGRSRGTFVFVTTNAKTFVVVLGDVIQPKELYSLRGQPLAGAGVAMNHRRYIVPYMGWYHTTAQVVLGTWRAADCRWNYGVIVPGNQ